MSSLILLSGGLDSLCCLAKRPVNSECLFFDYGQPAAKREWNAVIDICNHYHVKLDAVDIPDINPIGIIYPFRNGVLLSHAVSVAQQRGLKYVVIGCTRTDYNLFPDCRRKFLDSMRKTALDVAGVAIEYPLIYMDREEVVAECKRLKAPMDISWSCYCGEEEPCGVCESCRQVKC